MATLKLNKKPAPRKTTADGEKRAPLRGKGVSRPRQTLEQVQAERKAFEQRRAEERGPSEERGPARPARPARPAAPGERPARSGDRPAKPSGGFRREEQQGQQRNEGRALPRGEGRPAPRGEGRPAPRGEGRAAPRQDSRPQRSDERPPRQSDRNDRDDRGGFRGGDRNEGQFNRDDAPPPRRDQRRNTGPRFDQPYGQQAPQPRQRREPVEPPPEGERLSKRMGELGIASRREADEWIEAGWVRVDGKMAHLGQRVLPDAKIEVDDAAHQQQATRVTILLHKPIGYVSGQAEDGYEPAAVLIKQDTHWGEDTSGIKFHPGQLRGLAPAGRLDIDSTGLLVLTQDGRVAKALIGEDSLVEKEYLVRVEYVGRNGVKSDEGFTEQDLALLRHGLELDGVQLKPANVSWANEDQLRFVLREGRKRQIRRMCELVGLKVVGLKRVRIGRIPLGKLPVGEWRYLTPWERF
ncbi:pseudouridine synthase [Pelomonas sp. V22]|uniref:pseudouridine synthase n=1 Tax=Pelomonas sp. V22 TaxID=2822139 RepID=UPI0024A85189|nr:pseudouridine synthase [Pelomonas sp. V22]MDI4631469.1 pseudouridine synthase [Pelomonas sp. V22]